MSKHTPGPWTYEFQELCSGWSGIVYDANGYRVGTDHLTEANARLIAAAPDLLAALKDFVDGAEEDCGDPDCADCAGWRPARAAIAKATGEQP